MAKQFCQQQEICVCWRKAKTPSRWLFQTSIARFVVPLSKSLIMANAILKTCLGSY